METITSAIQELAQTTLQNIKQIQALNLIKIYPSAQTGGGVSQFPTNQHGDMYIPAVGTDEFVEMAQSVQANINSVPGRQTGGVDVSGLDTLDTRVWMNTREDAVGGQLGCGDAMSANLSVKQCINRLRANCPLITSSWQSGGEESKAKEKGQYKGKAAPIRRRLQTWFGRTNYDGAIFCLSNSLSYL